MYMYLFQEVTVIMDGKPEQSKSLESNLDGGSQDVNYDSTEGKASIY